MGNGVAKNKDEKRRAIDEIDGREFEQNSPVVTLDELKELIHEKRNKFFIDAKEAESWLKQKSCMSLNFECGKDENTSLALLAKHESFISELKLFYSSIHEIKLEASQINELELGIIMEGTQQNLETEIISANEMIHQVEVRYNDLITLARERQIKLNEDAKTFILLREANEHATSIQDVIYRTKLEFQTYHKEIDQSKFMKKYENFQTNVRQNEAHLYCMEEIIKEILKLGKNEDAQKIKTKYESLNKEWNEIFTNLESIYAKHKFRLDVNEINFLIKQKLNAMYQMVGIGRDLETVKALQERQEAFEGSLDFVTEKVQEVKKRQEHFMQTNADIVIDMFSQLEEINRDWDNLIEGMYKWKDKLYKCYEIFRNILNCHEMMERMNIRLPRISTNDYDVDCNNNIQ